MTGWIYRILRGDGDEARDRADLEEIADCLAELSFIGQKMAKISERQS